ncbi:MAG: hypothetical protein GY862_35490 [Gammaproteobacteria bacterium]|nr:hypothetical protein [Gammaproteobacteria bacterium]
MSIKSFVRTLMPGFIPVFGVLLPLVTLGLELATGMCAETFFDPVPTLVHALLVGFVPVANWWVLWHSRPEEKRDAARLAKLGLINGFALGVAGFYTLLFLPLLPLGAIAILFFGLGFLVMAPFFSLIATIVCYRRLKALAREEKRCKTPGVRWGFASALLILVALGVFGSVTQFGLHLAASPENEVSGIRLLRAVGDRERMLEACYERPAVTTNMFGLMFALVKPVSVREARQIYFRVTGVPFNAVPPPKLSGRGRWRPNDVFVFDAEQGGNVVGGRLKGLFLTDSRMDGSVDADAVVSYMEWTLVFKNRAARAREARAEIMLPPGGVVSRLTLWIGGEEREAAFAAKRKVREAYQRVVQRRRDPVLVTTGGPDRVLVQCFPVPVHGEMKIRLGISAPLTLENRTRALLRLPYIPERNFSINAKTRHSVWFEAKRALVADDEILTEENPEKNLYAIRGSLSDAALSQNQTIRAERADIVDAWSDDVRHDASGGEDETAFAFQTLRETPMAAPRRVVFVVDGSRGMRDAIPAVADALSDLPEKFHFDLLFAGDEIKQFPHAGSAKLAATWLKSAKYAGGQDNIPALQQAWEAAVKQPRSAIVWIHAPAPTLLTSAELLARNWDRRPHNPKLYEIQVSPGPNRIMQKLDGIAAVRSIPRFGSPAQDLRRLFAQWKGEAKHFSPVRKRVTALAGPAEEIHQTSPHLARLLAYDEVLEKLASPNRGSRQEAVRIATRYQLVTPVSGAVVLETEAQYREAKLHPADPSKVPTIPEPETWLLICVVLLLLIWIALTPATFSRRKGPKTQGNA